MFGLLHVAHERRKVRDASSVGFAEFDSPIGRKYIGHKIASEEVVSAHKKSRQFDVKEAR